MGRQILWPREGWEGFAHPDGHPAWAGALLCPGEPPARQIHASTEGQCLAREGALSGQARNILKPPCFICVLLLGLEDICIFGKKGKILLQKSQ